MRIDWWTLGFQAVNVVILVWLLQRFFWRPVAGMIAERRTAVQKALSGSLSAKDALAEAQQAAAKATR